MKNRRTISANDNVPFEVRMEEAFPKARTAHGNPITDISEKWLKGEEYLYVGRSKEGFHAAVAIPGHDHSLNFGKAFPTTREASASVGPEKKDKCAVARFSRPVDKNAPSQKPPSRSR